MDWIRDFGSIIAGIAVFIMTAVAAWVQKISTRVHGAHKRIGETNTRVAILENNHNQQTELLREIKEELKGMREDGRRRHDAFNDQMENMRREVKADLAAKADKQ